MFRTPSLGDSISVALRKLLQGDRGEVELNTSLQQREQAVWTSKIRYQVKEFSLLCMGRCKPLGLLNSFLSYALQYLWPILFPYSPCFLHFPSSSAVTMGGGSTLWIIVLGALIHTWRQEVGDGCGISCWLIWQEIVSFHICVSQVLDISPSNLDSSL